MTTTGVDGTGSPPGRTPRLAQVAEALLFQLPGAEAPGLAACGVVLLRFAALPALALTLVFAPLAVLAPGVLTDEGGQGADAIGAVILWVSIAFAQETGRYAFVRRARRPGDALLLYTLLFCLLFACILLVRQAPPWTFLWVLGAEVGAAIALRKGLPWERDRGLLVAGLVLTHAAVYIYAPLIAEAVGGPGPS